MKKDNGYVNNAVSDSHEQFAKASKHYDKKYFRFQAEIGEFGGWADKPIFDKFINKNCNVVDFGCGGGYLLKNIKCKGKIGIEINDSAIEIARNINKLTVYKSIASIPDNWADIIISNHALEHVLNPLEELKNAYSKLKIGGKIIFVVPCESIHYEYCPNDINHHLYTWSPMCLGNLFTEAGFHVIESKSYIYKWPPRYRYIALLGRTIFDMICVVYGHINRKLFQVKVIATKK